MSGELPRRLAGGLALALIVAGVPAAGQEAARGQVTNLPLPRFVSMRADKANARRGPSLNQRVDWEFLHRGLPLEVTAEYGQWRRVQDADGAGGWVHHSLLSGVRTALVRASGPVALRAGPTDGAAVRAMAEPGVVVGWRPARAPGARSRPTAWPAGCRARPSGASVPTRRSTDGPAVARCHRRPTH